MLERLHSSMPSVTCSDSSALALALCLSVAAACGGSEPPGSSNDSGDSGDSGTSVDSNDATTSGTTTSASDASTSAPADSTGSEDTGTPVGPDFSAVDARLDEFVADNAAFEGASIVLVDRDDGTMHEAAFGAYTLDTVVMLASTSKVPSSMLMMALHDDDTLDFEIDTPAEDYLAWDGAWPGVTAEQMLSNTSGLPGLQHAADYDAHLCQYGAIGSLLECGQTIYETPLPGLPSNPPGTVFDYGGSQWQLAGALGEVVGGQTWTEMFDQYIAAPCELEVFAYGNMWSDLEGWSGSADSLVGQNNPSIEGGAISNLDDYAKLLMLHLDEGRCGETQVLTPESVAFMRVDRGTPAGSRATTGMGYGMGWWIIPRDESEPYLFVDPGAFGAVSWIDLDRGYGGFVAIADYTTIDAQLASGMIITEIIPLVEAALDAL